MSLGNVRAEIWNRPSSHACILMGYFLITTKGTYKVKRVSTQQQEYDALRVQYKILSHMQ